MRAQMAGLCADWRWLGHRLGFGIGISLGYATVGMVGSEGRYEYTASGTAVNLAARLCEEAGDGEILLMPTAPMRRAGEPHRGGAYRRTDAQGLLGAGRGYESRARRQPAIAPTT